MSLLIFGCRKENSPPSSIVVSQKPQSNYEKASVVFLFNWFDDGARPGVDGLDYGCDPSKGNCHAEIVIHGSVDVGKLCSDLNTGSPSDDQQTFKDYDSFLTSFMDSSDFSNVVNGLLTVRTLGDYDTNGRAYLILDNSSAVNSVYPLVKP